MIRTKDGWRVQDCQIAARLYAERADVCAGAQSCFFIIARKVGRSEQAVRKRFDKFGPDFGEDHVRRKSHYRLPPEELKRPPTHIENKARTIYVPPQVLADRDRRLELEQSTTAALCGDPLPGYSMLDRQREEKCTG